MHRIALMLVALLLLSACKPFSNESTGNQFSLQKNRLYFEKHDIAMWGEATTPKCVACSFNIYTKKMVSGAMLFKQINNERGDLVLLSAGNVKYSFALQTGGHIYSLRLANEAGRLKINIDQQPDLFITLGQQQQILLAGQAYIIQLQKIIANKASADLLIWRKSN